MTSDVELRVVSGDHLSCLTRHVTAFAHELGACLSEVARIGIGRVTPPQEGPVTMSADFAKSREAPSGPVRGAPRN